MLISCAPVRQGRDLEAQKRLHCRLTFDSVTTVVAVVHRTTGEDVPTLLYGILELAGQVESMRGDTLIMEPHYIAKASVSPSGALLVVRVTNKTMLPDLVFVPVGPGVHVDESDDARRRRPSVGSLLAFATLVLYFAFYRW
jgi:hypothetical protein